MAVPAILFDVFTYVCMTFVLRLTLCLLQDGYTITVKPSVTDDEEVEKVTGTMDCDQAGADATDEDVVEIWEQGTSHGQMIRKRSTKAVLWTYFILETDENGALKYQDTPVCTVVHT